MHVCISSNLETMYPVAARENSEKNLMQREETTLLVA